MTFAFVVMARRVLRYYFCIQVMAYPGQSFSIPIWAFDELNQPAAGVFSVHEMDVVTSMHVSCKLPYLSMCI